MRTTTRRPYVLAATAIAALATSLAGGAALAAPGENGEVSADGVLLTVDIEDEGALSMSVDTSTPVVLAENGSDDEVRQFTGTLPTVTVTDTRAESPAGAYWSVIGNTGDFVDVDDATSTISGTYLGWAPALVEVPVGDDLVSEGEAVESEADGGTGVVGGYDLLVSAFDSEGAREYGSEWKANAALSLRVPVAEAAPGSYESTLTLSLFENE